MLTKQMQITAGIGITLLTVLVLLQGCGEISGEFIGNQAPTVEIVNVPQNAADSTLTQQNAMPFQVAQLGRPVAILSMQGTAMQPGSEKVYGSDPNAPFIAGVDYYMAYDSSWVDTLQSGQFITRSAQGALVALPGGSILPNTTYFIDFRFNIINFYVFSYAPTLHWVGYDADGFVDHYLYADVTDTAFISGFKDAEETGGQFGYLLSHQSQITWYDTTAMQARVYLLTLAGDTTEHLFFVKSVDNLGVESSVDYKTFYRSNNPPNNPLIKPQSSPDAAYGLHVYVIDTLFCLDEITPNWGGIAFNWRSDDPDDKSLYQIPLQYTHYLIKTPGDTLWAWSDSVWSDVKTVQMSGLETGSYVLSAWCRDDAFTLCDEAATISFNVVRPSFQHHILVVDETFNGGTYEFTAANSDCVNVFWQNLLTGLQGQLDYDNYVMDGVDVKFKDNSNYNAPDLAASPIPYSLISQYKLVIFYHDSHTMSGDINYVNHRNQVLADYLDVGGRVWYEGRNVLYGAFRVAGAGNINVISSSSFLGEYMQLITGYAAKYPNTASPPDFMGGIPTVEGLPAVSVDSNHVNLIGNLLYLPNFYPNRQALLEVDWFTRSNDAVTLYTYNSTTTDTSLTPPTILNENSEVVSGSTPVHCTVQPLKQPVMAVYRVYNASKGVTGEIESYNPYTIQVSYPYGQPWESSDTLEVDYRYDPISQNQLKPVAMRYENQPRVLQIIIFNGIQVPVYTTSLGYRTAMFTFPLFFLKNDNGQVQQITKDMLNWFFYPGQHYVL